MAARIDVIQTGYANLTEPTRMSASGSSTLVRSGSSLILFDTMGPWEKDKIIESLAKLKIHPHDIDYLVCSHSHPDHIGNNNLFTRARLHIVGTSVYERDNYDLSCFKTSGAFIFKTSKGEEVEVSTHENFQLTTHARVEPTPGHTLECVTLFVDNCDNHGSVALVGDLFENESDITNENVWLSAGSQNPSLQRAHRTRVYNMVETIVPGHGASFKVDSLKPIKF